MFSCLGRLGCLFLILVAGALAWMLRDRWVSRVPGLAEDRSTVTWESVTDTGAREARAAVGALARSGGPAYTTLSAAELASLMVAGTTYRFPEALDSVRAAVDGDLVRLGARVQLDAVRGLDALGPLGGILDKRERIELTGTLSVVREGLGQFRVAAVQVGDFQLPRAAIPRLLDRLDRRQRPDGIAPDGIAIDIPDYVGDVRVGQGKVTLYRRTP